MDKLQDQSITALILLGTFGMLFMIGGFWLFILVYQRRLIREKQKRAEQELDFQNRMIKMQLDSQEQERKRIGADLHDSLGSLLWGAKINVAYIKKSAILSDDTMTTLNDLTKILDESIESVRRIAWELTPEAFQYTGLSTSVARLCERLGGKEIQISVEEENQRLWNDARALQTFRIIQELISNTLKHSHASLLSISMKWNEEKLKIRVQDNGLGFMPNEQKKGIGLWNINQRVKQLNGNISIGDPPTGSGVQVLLDIPLLS